MLIKTVRSLKMQAEKKQTWPRQTLTLSQYVEFRNGVPLGVSKSFTNMLHRSLGAASFAEFWQYWNPIWGYGLGKYVYAPARRIFARAATFIATFIVSGAIHDLATMAVSRSFPFCLRPGFSCWVWRLCWGRLWGWILGNGRFGNEPP
jgi:hypothetical protein